MVDPSRIMQSIYTKLLVNLGIVSPAYSVEEAFELLDADSFKLIITDFVFARRSGLELIRRVRESFTPLQLPLIMVSASMDPGLKQDALNAGANLCVAKPPDFKRFIEAVSQMLAAPFVDSSGQDSVYYTSVSWSREEKVYYYCPELRLLVHAGSSGEALQQLEKSIRMEISKGAHPARIGVPSVNRCLLKPLNKNS